MFYIIYQSDHGNRSMHLFNYEGSNSIQLKDKRPIITHAAFKTTWGFGYCDVNIRFPSSFRSRQPRVTFACLRHHETQKKHSRNNKKCWLLL